MHVANERRVPDTEPGGKRIQLFRGKSLRIPSLAAIPLSKAVFGMSSAEAKQSASNSFGSCLRRFPRSSTNSSNCSPCP